MLMIACLMFISSTTSEASVGVRRSMAALSLVVVSETTFGGERVRKHVLDASRTSDARTPKTGLG